MAEKVIIEFELSTEQAQKSLENYLKSIQKINDSFTDASKKGVDSMNNVDKEVKESIGLINKLREQESLLKKQRDSANDVNSLRKFNNELRKTQTELQRLESVGKSAFSKILADAKSTFAGIAAFNIVQSTLQGVKDIFSTGFNAAMANEDFLISTEVMLGSADAAKQLTQDLTELAARTPFESSDLQRASQILLGFGVEADKLIPTLKSLGDVSGGNSEKLDRLSLAFGQVRGKTRLMAQEVNQMIEAGFNPLQEISRTTGKSMATLTAEMEKGLIGFDQVEKAFTTVTSEGGKFFNMLERRSTTTSGKISTLKDNFIILLRNGVNLFLPAINSFIDFLSSTITYIYAFGVAIASIPKFVKENIAIFALLGSAILAFNGALILSTVSLLSNLAAQKLVIITTRAFNAALVVQKALLLNTPWGVFTSLILAATAAYSYFNKKVNEGLAIREQVIESLGEELNKLNDLVLVASNAARTTEERNNAIAEMNELYKIYLPYLLDERDSLEQIKFAQEEVTRVMINNGIEKLKQKAIEEDFTNQLKRRIKVFSDLDKAQNVDKEAIGQRLQELQSIGDQLAADAQLAEDLKQAKDEYNRVYQEKTTLQITDDKDKKRFNEATIELKKLENQILDLENSYNSLTTPELTKQFQGLTKEVYKLITGVDTVELSTIFTDPIKGFSDTFKNLSNLFDGEKQLLLESTSQFIQGFKGRTNILNSHKAAFDGFDRTVKKNTDTVNSNAGGSGSAHGKAAKQYEYNLKLIEANTKAIEANIIKMQEQTDLIILQEKQRKAKATAIKVEIDSQALQTSVLKRESLERQNIAIAELQKDRDREKEKLDDAKQKAELRLKNEFITTEERTRILTFITTEYEKNKTSLTENYEKERSKIVSKYQTDTEKVLEFSYQRQVQFLNTYIDEQKEALKKGIIELNDINKQFQVAKIADIGSSQAQGTSQLIEKDRQIENENLTQKEILIQKEKHESEKLQLQEKYRNANTKNEKDAVQLELDAHNAKLQVIENDFDASAQRKYSIEYNYLQQVNELNLRILNEQIEAREKAEQQIQDRLSSIRDNVAKQGGLGGEIGANIINLGNDFIKLQVKYEQTTMAKRLKERKDGLQKLYDAEVAKNGESSELAKELKKQIQDIDNEIIQAQIDFNKKRFDSTVDFILNSVLAVTSALNQIIDVQIAQQDRLIKAQEQRVEDAEKLAEKGNAVQLKLEKQRLDDLNKEREKFVRKQQALAVIELLANSAAAIAKSANIPPPFNIIAIAATVAALGAGLVAAKQKAQTAASGFKTGGYTGDGNINDVKGPVHAKEFVFTAEKTAKYKPIFQAIHENRLDLNKALYAPRMKESVLMMGKANYTNLDTSNMEKRLESIEIAINSINIPQTNVSINEHGIFAITEKQRKLNNRLK